MSRHIHQGRGFSILELMIAMMIFLTSFIMIIGVFPVTFQSIQMSKDSLIATHIAAEKLELVKAMDYGSIALANLPNGSIAMTCMVNGVRQDLAFNYSFFVTQLDVTGDGVNDDIKEVRVQVSWTHGDMVHYTDMITRISKLQ